MIRAYIPLNPVSKKNSSRIVTNRSTGKPFILPSKKYTEYENEAGWYIHPPMRPIDYPVNVQMIFYMETFRRVDLVNLQEACLDVLVKYGMLEDDNSNIVVSMNGSEVRHDRANPRTEILIERVNDGRPENKSR